MSMEEGRSKLDSVIFYSVNEEEMQRKSWVSDCSVPNLESYEVDGKSSIDLDRIIDKRSGGPMPDKEHEMASLIAPQITAFEQSQD
ncbi:hypothetical protein llap_5426 [Limosa lapponica baueri]|uniref:Uncharacterized protein n=1 Tax=Limosa lapponica baueri TaxID=1758121 RepID=A0A2I0UDY2_LIMLA|nr:hypothetical protein llap_5426 [Limosa lapponica baueri]